MPSHRPRAPFPPNTWKLLAISDNTSGCSCGDHCSFSGCILSNICHRIGNPICSEISLSFVNDHASSPLDISMIESSRETAGVDSKLCDPPLCLIPNCLK